MKAWLAEGEVYHNRFHPITHQLNYPFTLVYTSLEALPELSERLKKTYGFLQFRRKDYLRPKNLDLDAAVRFHIAQQQAVNFEGDIYLLSQLRGCGFLFNHLTFYYCYSGQQCVYVVAEVRNTPWHESHVYVLPVTQEKEGCYTAVTEKKLHVSPFNPMDLQYHFLFTQTEQQILVHMDLYKNEHKTFNAGMSLRKKECTLPNLKQFMKQSPLQTYRVFWNIYSNAYILWRKGAPFYSHPSSGDSV